jgi:hypothetical protein
MERRRICFGGFCPSKNVEVPRTPVGGLHYVILYIKYVILYPILHSVAPSPYEKNVLYDGR